jgi:ribulose-phosphate 3-epimerase
VKTSVSLWSADLLDVGAAMARVEQEVAGFHIDIMDGHFVPNLVFGPDFVHAVAARTQRLVDVHLMVTDADLWIDPFAEAGAGMLTVHTEACADVTATLTRIEALGVRPALAVSVDDPLEAVWPLLERVDRVLLMGTRLGIKGVGIDPTIYARIQATVDARSRSTRRPEVYVDGGIRRDIVPSLAQAGADGVTPGSLVYGDADPAAAVRWIASQVQPVLL